MENQPVQDSAQIQKGSYLMWAISSFLILHQLVDFRLDAQYFVRLLFYGILLVLVYMGYSWARVILALILGIRCLSGLYAAFYLADFLNSDLVLYIGLLLSLVYSLAAASLFTSKSIIAYLGQNYLKVVRKEEQ